MVECSRLRRSNARRLPSAPTETKMSVEPGSHATSYTSRSCAMSCVIALCVSMFHTVHVVSIDDVTTRLGAFSFHEKFVSGAPVCPFCTLLCCTPLRQRRSGKMGTTARTPESPIFCVSLCPLLVGGRPT